MHPPLGLRAMEWLISEKRNPALEAEITLLSAKAGDSFEVTTNLFSVQPKRRFVRVLPTNRTTRLMK